MSDHIFESYGQEDWASTLSHGQKPATGRNSLTKILADPLDEEGARELLASSGPGNSITLRIRDNSFGVAEFEEVARHGGKGLLFDLRNVTL